MQGVKYIYLKFREQSVTKVKFRGVSVINPKKTRVRKKMTDV